MATHSVACYRTSTKCKICGERLLRSKKAEHLTAWRDSSKILAAIEQNNEADLTLVLDHGVDPEFQLEPGKDSNHSSNTRLCSDVAPLRKE